MNARSLLQGWPQLIRSGERMKTGAKTPPLRGAGGVSTASSKKLSEVIVRENTPLTPLKGGIIRVLLFFMLLITAACSTYNPAGTTGDTTILIAPTELSVKLGAGVVELSWQFSGDLKKVQEFRVYRRSAGEVAFRRVGIDSLKTKRYRDSAVVIGARYEYQVAAVNKSNLEGDHSESIAITPVVFGVQIANGAKFTNRRLVLLSFNVPDNTALMMLSEDTTKNAQWEPFNNNKTFELLAPDEGKKLVFAKFRSSTNVESTWVQDDIILDTIAFIRAITHDGAGRVLRPGDILHISLNAGEPLGNATVDLIDNANGSNTQDNNIRLFDNGSNGDVTRDDGVYELDYRIRPDMEFAGAFVYGSFTDAATNAAPMLVSGNSFSAQLPPKAVRLSNPVPDSTGLKLTWTVSNEKDFANYRIYRSTTSPVDTVATPLTILNDKSATTYRDAAVTPSTTYFYRVFVFDRFGLSAGSNQVQGRL